MNKNKLMKEITETIYDKLSKDLSESKEIELTGEIRIPGTNIVLEAGDKIVVKEAMSSMTLDVAYDRADDFIKLLTEAEFKYKLQMRIITMEGPGSRWPEIQFVGESRNLEAFFVEAYGGEPEDYIDFID
jgi:hypothetical protein